MLLLLVAVPALAALFAFALPWNRPRRALLLVAALLHAGLTVAAAVQVPPPELSGWIALDPAGLLFLGITTTVYFIATCYTIGYLAREVRHLPDSSASDVPFVNFPEAVFTGCLLLFLAAMTLVILSQNWGLMWVAVEATTLASAPLIYFHRHARSLEATWKYLVICSVGIALALLGNFFLAVSARESGHVPLHLSVPDLERHARLLEPLWLKAAFLLLLVGYGTKMGLAPLHTWLPDAHSEAPSMVSALLSGVLLNCAFLAILRGNSLLVKAGLGDFSHSLLVLFGLLSMGIAAVFIINQMDYKRLLAYSSIEHMGILVLGAGVGGLGGFGSMLHAVNHSLTKAMLFLAAGNTLALFRTKSTQAARGTLQLQPVTGILWLVGLLAITGSPPFGTFLSELAVLKGIFDSGRPLVGVFYLTALGAIFVGMSAVILPMVYGRPVEAPPAGVNRESSAPGTLSPALGREPWWSLAPPLLLGAGTLVLGVYLPPPLAELLHSAARTLGVE